MKVGYIRVLLLQIFSLHWHNCSDTSDTDSALGILKFPEEDYHSDIDFTGDGDDDEIENMDTMEIHFNLPASLTELQKKLFVRVYLWGRP